MTAKIPDSGLLDFEFTITDPSYAWTPTATNYNRFNFNDNTPVWTESVSITLQGAADSNSEPYTTMNWWFSLNAGTISANGFTNAETFKVSSWAIVVDVNFKASAPAFYSAV